MTYSSGSRITRNKSIKRFNLSRDGGEFDTQKESRSYGHNEARKAKNDNRFQAWGE